MPAAARSAFGASFAAGMKLHCTETESGVAGRREGRRALSSMKQHVVYCREGERGIHRGTSRSWQRHDPMSAPDVAHCKRSR
eukprot:1006915-Rhodomonas_salina.1